MRHRINQQVVLSLHRPVRRRGPARAARGRRDPRCVRRGDGAHPRTLDGTYVKKLRRKLGDNAARPAYIINERGVGYRMARPDDA